MPIVAHGVLVGVGWLASLVFPGNVAANDACAAMAVEIAARRNAIQTERDLMLIRVLNGRYALRFGFVSAVQKDWSE